MTDTVLTTPTSRLTAATRYGVAMHYVRLLLDYAAERGLAAERLWLAVGADPALLGDADGRLDFDTFLKLCGWLAQELDDPSLGLHLGQSIKPGYYGPHGFSLISCGNARELMRRSMRYSSLVLDAYRNEIKQDGDTIVRYWRSNLPLTHEDGRRIDEQSMAAWITLARWMLGDDSIAPDWVSFRHPAPAGLAAYEALFRCPLRFAAEDTAVAFPARYLDRALPQANAQVAQMMDALCAQLLQRLQAERSPAWLADCERTIVRSFEGQVPELAGIAAAIGMAPRELRHRLAEHGLNFRELADRLRHELARDYLAKPALSLVDIAYLLGFSEQSAFQRAFKRWAGCTPGEYRRNGGNA
ncbi:AraC family transcriptional regulator [Chitinivorax sp. PXF-14]|uniref:AraC family transcriptional regulator n=1 Tax=Chitinivorax sp. PXF-14 TaxID=3230488 RepID=UPI003465AA5D